MKESSIYWGLFLFISVNKSGFNLIASRLITIRYIACI